MSSETRLVRPYVGGDEFQRMLDGCTLRCADQTIEGGSEAAVGLEEYLNFPFTLELDRVDWSLGSEGASALGLEASDVDLLVLAVAPRLRFVDIVFRSDLPSIDPSLRQIPLSDEQRPRALRAPHGGADIQVFFCLNRSRDPRPMQPWRRGTWLGRQDFRLRSELTGSGFVPIRMTDDDREQLGLPRDTVRYTTLDDGDPFDTDPASDMVKLYVDGDLLDRLAVSAGTPAGRQIQQQLFLDAATAIVFAAQRRFRESPELGTQHVDDFRGSLAHRIVEYVAGRGGDASSKERRQNALRQMRDDPVVLLAHLEARTGIRRELISSLGAAR